MKVIDFIKQNKGDLNCLNTTYGIKIKEYVDGFRPNLYVLNYDQIESPKMEPVVAECRGLILDESLNIICRPFDRFFNYGEAETDKMDLTGYTYAPKLDGSLIKVYHWYGMWRIATRGTAFAESNVGDWGITFEQLALRAFGFQNLVDFDSWCMNVVGMNVGCTYLFELTAPENRVVTPYSDRKMTLLAKRVCTTGDYAQLTQNENTHLIVNSTEQGLTISQIIEQTAALGDLKEGFVGYDQFGVPRVKVKSAAYVAVHHLRGEGLNPKRISELVISGETEEYLTYFPEDRDMITPYLNAWDTIKEATKISYVEYSDIESQKDFAIAISKIPTKSVLFTARKNKITTDEAFGYVNLSTKVDWIKYVVDNFHIGN